MARPALAGVLSVVLVSAITALATPQPRPTATPESRAVGYLATEVPRWRREHPCYSCHNNGDAIRALMAASRAGLDIGTSADDSTAWLATPTRWAENARRGGSEELPLGRLQFAGALASAVDAGRVPGDGLASATALVAKDQSDDGSWTLNVSASLGGPTFYGTAVATAVAHRVLSHGPPATVKSARDRATAWLLRLNAQTVTEASAVLWALADDASSGARASRRRALDVIRRGQGPDGGWGPYVNAPSEVFDTAFTVLALAGLTPRDWTDGPLNTASGAETIARGRRHLVESQLDDGSWAETTRPPGGESYAQRISTTAWALLALLATRPAG